MVNKLWLSLIHYMAAMSIQKFICSCLLDLVTSLPTKCNGNNTWLPQSIDFIISFSLSISSLLQFNFCLNYLSWEAHTLRTKDLFPLALIGHNFHDLYHTENVWIWALPQLNFWIQMQIKSIHLYWFH